jgi:hypothetical protein
MVDGQLTLDEDGTRLLYVAATRARHVPDMSGLRAELLDAPLLPRTTDPAHQRWRFFEQRAERSFLAALYSPARRPQILAVIIRAGFYRTQDFVSTTSGHVALA